MNKEILQKIKKIIKNTQDEISVDKFNLDGFSGDKLLHIIHSLSELLCSENKVYLEIGVFRGLTLLTNSKKNTNVRCYGIDNFSLFDENSENRGFIETKISEFGLNNCFLIDSDYEDGLENLNIHTDNSKIGVYFIDGAHDYRSQLVSLLQIKPFLTDDSIIIIDDANYPHVRQATNDFLKSHSEFALLFEAYTKSHPSNMNEEDFSEVAKSGWWNGVNIIVNDKDNQLPRNLTTEANKDLYFITHDIFRNKFAKISYDIIKLAQNSKFDELKDIMSLYSNENNLYEHQNTFSDSLTDFNLF
jgi:hypothetical protein